MYFTQIQLNYEIIVYIHYLLATNNYKIICSTICIL